MLSITAEAGLPIPEVPRAEMIAGMRAVLDGRLRDEEWRRAPAPGGGAGGARPTGRGDARDAGADRRDPGGDSDLAAIDTMAALDHIPAVNATAEAQLRARIVHEGTRLDLTDSSQQAWWLKSSGDEATIKALLTTLGRPGWQGEGPRMAVGVALRQVHGHWDTTTANAWGALAVCRFARFCPAQAVAGTTTVSFGARLIARGWPLAAEARARSA